MKVKVTNRGPYNVGKQALAPGTVFELPAGPKLNAALHFKQVEPHVPDEPKPKQKEK